MGQGQLVSIVNSLPILKLVDREISFQYYKMKPVTPYVPDQMLLTLLSTLMLIGKPNAT